MKRGLKDGSICPTCEGTDNRYRNRFVVKQDVCRRCRGLGLIYQVQTVKHKTVYCEHRVGQHCDMCIDIRVSNGASRAAGRE